MDDLLNRFWQHVKAHRGGALVLFIIALSGALTPVTVMSDIGFGDEVKEHRYTILYSALGFSFLIAFLWFLIFSVREDRRLKSGIVNLERELNECRSESESASQRERQKDEDINHLQGTILNLLQELTASRVIEVSKVQFYKEKLYLRLKKRADLELRLGDEIRVLDKAEGGVMGVFEISEVNPEEYVAKSSAYVNSLWLGYVQLNAESSALPDSIAIYYPKDGNSYESE